MDKYNIYGEVEEAGVFNDITPADVSLNTYSPNNGHNLSLYMQSSNLGELAESDYRAEYGNYSVDFRISELLFIVD